MKVTTVRLPEDLVDDVEAAAEDTGRSQSEYIRHALRIHFEYKPNTDGDRVEQLEARVEALEAGGGGGMRVENPEMPKSAANEGRGGRSSGHEHWGKEGENRIAQLHTTVDEVAEEVLPGSGSKLDDRHEALTAVVTYLIRHGRSYPRGSTPTTPGGMNPVRTPRIRGGKTVFSPGLV